MKVELKSIKGTWEDVANRARTTVHKDELGKEPSDSFKRFLLLMIKHKEVIVQV